MNGQQPRWFSVTQVHREWKYRKKVLEGATFFTHPVDRNYVQFDTPCPLWLSMTMLYGVVMCRYLHALCVPTLNERQFTWLLIAMLCGPGVPAWTITKARQPERRRRWGRECGTTQTNGNGLRKRLRPSEKSLIFMSANGTFWGIFRDKIFHYGMWRLCILSSS